MDRALLWSLFSYLVVEAWGRVHGPIQTQPHVKTWLIKYQRGLEIWRQEIKHTNARERGQGDQDLIKDFVDATVLGDGYTVLLTTVMRRGIMGARWPRGNWETSALRKPSIMKYGFRGWIISKALMLTRCKCFTPLGHIWPGIPITA